MGARGNSGVGRLRFFDGIAEGLVIALKSWGSNSKGYCSLFRRGKVAFKAVREACWELTVLRTFSAKADSLEKSQLTPVEVLDALVVEAYESICPHS